MDLFNIRGSRQGKEAWFNDIFSKPFTGDLDFLNPYMSHVIAKPEFYIVAQCNGTEMTTTEELDNFITSVQNNNIYTYGDDADIDDIPNIPVSLSMRGTLFEDSLDDYLQLFPNEDVAFNFEAQLINDLVGIINMPNPVEVISESLEDSRLFGEPAKLDLDVISSNLQYRIMDSVCQSEKTIRESYLPFVYLKLLIISAERGKALNYSKLYSMVTGRSKSTDERSKLREEMGKAGFVIVTENPPFGYSMYAPNGIDITRKGNE